MDVLIVTGIFPPDHGGPASYVPIIAEGIKSAGHNIIGVVTLSDSIDESDTKFSFPVYRITRSRIKILRWAIIILKVAKLAKSADIVYLNGLVLEGVVAAKILVKRPVVIKVVGDLIWEKARNCKATSLELDEFQECKLSPKWKFLRWLQSYYMNCADAIIVPSNYLATVVKNWKVPSQKITVVYNSVKVPRNPEKIITK
jgi:glycosyltransferase involved in cell wall biosynthesis